MAQGPLKIVPRDMVEKKPGHGEACNNCGLCCHSSLCEIGRELFGKDKDGPCPALRWRGDGTSFCNVMESPQLYTDRNPDEARNAAKVLLYAGWGCTMRINGEFNHDFNNRLSDWESGNVSLLTMARELWKLPPLDEMF